MTDHNAAYYDRQFADRGAPNARPEGFVHPPVSLSEVWCRKCDQPATVEMLVNRGGVVEMMALCDQDAWVLRAPRGGKGAHV
jgi:hypothetical protein